VARPHRIPILLCLTLLATACSQLRATDVPTTSPSPTPLPPSTPAIATLVPTITRPPLPTTTPEPDDTGWRALAPGIEWRRLWADTAAGRERLRLVRIAPSQVHLRVVYQPSHPRKLSQWATALPNALIIINAGYFTPEYQAMGLIISDGVPAGSSYDDFAGMLAVNADGQVTLRWLRTWPLRPDERLAQAVQSFPVLVKPGGLMGFPPDADQGQPSRRTVVAQDTAGRIILLVGPEFRFSLHELATWLAESDLQLDIALNLDGGTSTGLWISGHDEQIDSQVPVPAVILFEPAQG
jgi:uncharacterized protein YigE (DUF2233 family)